MHRRPPHRSLAGLALALVLALPATACGGSSGGDGADAPRATAGSTAAPEGPSLTTAAPTTAASRPEAPCRTTGTLTGDAEVTWTDVPTSILTDNGAEPIGTGSPTQFKVDTSGSILSIFAAGQAPAAAKVTVLTGTATTTYLADDVGGTVAADGAQVDVDLAKGADAAAHLRVTITCR